MKILNHNTPISMERINKCTFWSDCICLDITCTNKTIDILKRLCFIGGVQHDNSIQYYHGIMCMSLKIIITSKKELDKIIPQLKKLFPDDIHLEDGYLKQYKKFFI